LFGDAVMATNVEFVSPQESSQEVAFSKTSDFAAQGVLIRNASKIYGVGKKRCAVLNGIDMSVNKGTM
jgi:hypothetical protein